MKSPDITTSRGIVTPSQRKKHQAFTILSAHQPMTRDQLTNGLNFIIDNRTRDLTPRQKRTHSSAVAALRNKKIQKDEGGNKLKDEKGHRILVEGYHPGTKIQITLAPEQGSDSNTVHVISRPASFDWRLTYLNKPRTRKEFLEKINSGGIAMIVITKDGYIAVEERSEACQTNRGVVGPFGGGLDGIVGRAIIGDELNETIKTKNTQGKKPNIRRDAILLNATQEQIKKQGLTEVHEEMGASIASLESSPFRIIGFEKDNEQGHNDVVGEIKLDLTAEELGLLYLHHKSFDEDLSDPMPAKVGFIPANPEAIYKFLCNSNAKIAPVLQGALTLAGRSLLIDRLYSEGIELDEAVETGNQWMTLLEEDIIKNNQRLDKTVRRYNRTLQRQQHNEPTRRVSGYDKSLLPYQQGLSDLESALDDLGIHYFIANARLKQVYPKENQSSRSA